MIKIKEAVIVEGAYDKIKLSSYIDAVIYETGGFSVMSNEERLNTIKALARTTGIVIFTDSDSAGFRIRHFLNERIKDGVVKNAYIPDVEGKEKRKRVGGREGLLGVEGMTGEIIIKALSDAGCTEDCDEKKEKTDVFTSADLYALGLSGRDDSKSKREELLKMLKLPTKMSTKLMCDVLSRTVTMDEVKKMLNSDDADI